MMEIHWPLSAYGQGSSWLCCGPVSPGPSRRAVTGNLHSSPHRLWSSSGLPCLLGAAYFASRLPPWPPRLLQGPAPGRALWSLSLWPQLQPGPALLHSEQRRSSPLPTAAREQTGTVRTPLTRGAGLLTLRPPQADHPHTDLQSFLSTNNDLT